jgi:phosphoheptose isomerase
LAAATDRVEPAEAIAAVEQAEFVTAAVRYPGDYARMRFQQRIHEEVSLTAAMLLEIAADEALMDEIATVAEQFIACMRSGGKVLWCGNGGSAADAQHLAAEFVVRFTVGRPALPSLALTVDTSVLTACANDFGYEQVFARQVEALGHKGDVLVGMSTSGNSPTVLCALADCPVRAGSRAERGIGDDRLHRHERRQDGGTLRYAAAGAE